MRSSTIYCVEDVDYCVKVEAKVMRSITVNDLSRKHKETFLLCLKKMKINVPKFLKIKICGLYRSEILFTRTKAMKFSAGKIENDFFLSTKNKMEEFALVEMPKEKVMVIYTPDKKEKRFFVSFFLKTLFIACL